MQSLHVDRSINIFAFLFILLRYYFNSENLEYGTSSK